MGLAHNIYQSLWSYILLQNDSFVTRSFVIGLPSHELDSYHIKEEMNRLMEFDKTKIDNEQKPLYEANHPEAIYNT